MGYMNSFHLTPRVKHNLLSRIQPILPLDLRRSVCDGNPPSHPVQPTSRHSSFPQSRSRKRTTTGAPSSSPCTLLYTTHLHFQIFASVRTHTGKMRVHWKAPPIIIGTFNSSRFHSLVVPVGSRWSQDARTHPSKRVNRGGMKKKTKTGRRREPEKLSPGAWLRYIKID